ncbi:MAG TPA: RNA polymerase sigma-I factor [Sedimentibacter sp.]|nr:RNA polymerase sigma-I factor [Sedimentibacter sp.]HNZ83502.1 RNA polymerase sigma-I factor [Sedimentibacter sp.]HOH69711.1 RNA polymerase sigma-I factor [Sedimentibacter sp.]HPW99345.1 RNA polymerase sigma-I factor [Sedimentibacter sp.]HQB62935.1 RNA polymerase sigma-I factor [Sedimentibacter sp.]
MSDLDQIAIEAKNDADSMNKLIAQYENFMLKCASSAARRYISKSDDEWSIALSAFTEAIENYSAGKGSFLNFAELVIRRRMIDFMRSKSRYAHEISVNPSLFDTDSQDEEEYSMQSEIVKKVSIAEDNSTKMEIALINEIFSDYGFSFMDLVQCSPKSQKTKRSCAKAVAYLIKNPIIINEIKIRKQLPLNIIEKSTKVPRKMLERHRKYIIAAVEIMSGDFPNLAGYLEYIRRELEDESNNS